MTSKEELDEMIVMRTVSAETAAEAAEAEAEAEHEPELHKWAESANGGGAEAQETDVAEQPPTTTTTTLPCTGCAQLHKDIKKDVTKMMSKIEIVCERLELLIAEREKVQERMSESGSEEKYAPSTSGSQASPNPTPNGKAASRNGGCRKRKPTKESVNRHLENGLENGANGRGGSPVEKVARQISTPVSSNSPFPDFNNFNGFIFDPVANPQNMMQFLSLVQHQQQQQQQQMAQNPTQQAHQQKEVQQKLMKEEQTATVTAPVKPEPVESSGTPPGLPADQSLLDQLAAHFNVESLSPTVHAAAPAVNGGSEDDSASSTNSRCSNCSTIKTTAWRRDLEGRLVCNACGLYYRLHRTHRPVHMRKDFIQQRFRRKIKEEENPATTQAAVFSQLMGLPILPTGSAAAANAFTFLEQFNQLNQAAAAAQGSP